LALGAGIAADAPRQPAHSSAPRVSPSPLPPVALSADAIFLKAAAVARGNFDPPFLTYRLHEVFTHRGKRLEYDYRVWYRTRDGQGLMQNLQPGKGGGAETLFGHPFPFAPDINFLLYATPAPVSPPPPPVGSPAPQAQATVLRIEPVVSDRNYVPSLSGVETFRGHSVYHLKLRTVRQERDYPLKDLLVDASSFEVWQAHAAAAGTRGPAAGDIDGTAEFAAVGASWLVTRATGYGRLHVGFLSDSARYEYAFSDFGFPNSLPDWYFDERQFRRH
jgi:hypothetical protein